VADGIRRAPLWQHDLDDMLGTRGEEASMAGKFVLKKGTSGKYHFNLLAGNGQVIATSETYERKQSALDGIASVKNNATAAEIDDRTGE